MLSANGARDSSSRLTKTQQRRLQRKHSQRSYTELKTKLLQLVKPDPEGAIIANEAEVFRERLYYPYWTAASHQWPRPCYTFGVPSHDMQVYCQGDFYLQGDYSSYWDDAQGMEDSLHYLQLPTCWTPPAPSGAGGVQQAHNTTHDTTHLQMSRQLSVECQVSGNPSGHRLHPELVQATWLDS